MKLLFFYSRGRRYGFAIENLVFSKYGAVLLTLFLLSCGVKFVPARVWRRHLLVCCYPSRKQSAMRYERLAFDGLDFSQMSAEDFERHVFGMASAE